MKSFSGFLVVAALGAACGGDEPCDPAGGNICTVSGTGVAGFAGDGNDAREARLYLPQNVAVGSDGLLYVIDWNNHRIRVIDADGEMFTAAGTGLLGDGPPGPALESDFNHPTDLVFDGHGKMLVAAWHNSRIKSVDLATGALTDICGTGGRAYKGDGGPAEAAVLDLPSSIALHSDGRMFILDQANQVIRVVDGGVIERYAGMCLVNECSEGFVPEPCPDSDKMVCNLAGNPDACATPCKPGFAGEGEDRLSIRMAQPFGQAADPAGRIALDRDGNLYFADTSNHRIRKIAPDGVVTTVAGRGLPQTGGDGGPAVDAGLNRPVDLAVARDGTIYFTDVFNSCVRAVDPDGMIRSVAGQCGVRGFEGDGELAVEAVLDRPYGLGLDEKNGLLYIADTYNHRIRVVGL